MNPTGSLCANNWARSSSLVPPGNGLQTNLSLDPSSFFGVGIETPFKEINQPSPTQCVIPGESKKDVTDQETSKLQDWDPSAMLNNLSFLEEKIHQLQDVVHMIVNKKFQPFEQPRELVTQEQQLITADLTSIIVQLISTAGSLLPSVRNTVANTSPLIGQLSQLRGINLPFGTGTSSGIQPQNNCENKLFDHSIQNDVPNKCEMEQNHNMEEHEHKDEEDMEEGENLPPGSYEILQLEKEEILAPHTHFCTICGKGFKRDANLRMHMRGHGDEYKTPAALAKPHKETGSEPKLIKRYSCPYGGCKRNKDHKKFQPLKTILCVKNHYKRTHCDKSYTCSRCHTKKFSVIADLKTHEKHCGKDKWLCSCGTTFSRKDKLFGHIALFQGHTPAIPLEENKGLAEPPDRCDAKENVLDCCQHCTVHLFHRFCFVCIDNWASITNLCPLCQNEFQLITCVPVYDTIGSNKVEDGSLFGDDDDDWSIEGETNSLAFPSYYIDENAVTCLDGDGCKIRNGLASIEGDSGLDTSIACDSCDIWYHAFCVGFDTEGTSESTWLCPRCVVDEVSKETDTNSIKEATLECNPDNNNIKCHVEDSRLVSVSIADTGETAVVVSMLDRNKWVPETSERSQLPPEVDLLTESCNLMSQKNNQLQGTEKTTMSPIMEGEKLELSLSHNMSCNPTSKSSVLNDLKKSDNGTRCEPSSFDGVKLFDESNVKTSPCKIESDMGLHLGLSVGSFLSVDNVNKSKTQDQATNVPCSSPEEFLLKGDEIETNACEDNARVTGRKRKHVDFSHEQVHIKVDEDAKPELSAEASQKKIRAAASQMISANDSVDAQLSDKTKKSPVLKHSPTKETVASDIMNIVKGTKRRLSKGLAGTNASGKLAEKKENMAGLRVKKIMKRGSDDGESSSLVQNLRKEIREAVRNKSDINFGENHFDKNLLEAFRAAITGPKTELVNKLSPSALKARKSMLQKGKVRENLTRKIFASSNGRRKRAWDRDCEIEFWKYRCTRASKPEKIETLKSVLDLLKKSSENPESEQAPERQAKNPILSRLYIADTSVFPRKADVKPFSEQTKQNNSSAKGPNQSLDIKTIKATEVNNLLSKTSVCSSEKKVDKKIVRGPVGKAHLSSHSEGTSVSSSAGAKVGTKESVLKSDSMKTDKRKWALEVLARKTAVASSNTANESQEDDAIFKGNYPLLAQLPTDMRPVLAPCRHNKIPLSVRQTQLYRLTERLLRNTNLTIIHRTAHTELAVADAINIEKEVADRSNSKLVYQNLCSQELLRRTNNTTSNVDTDTSPPTSSPVHTDQSELNTDDLSSDPAVHTDQSELNTDDLSTDPAVQIALQNAGLLSDSPPSSPHKNKEIHNENEMSGPDDILELDSHPELDIYGDFEYDLEEDDYIGASVTNIPNITQEQSEPKVKLVFSTTSLKKTNNASDSADSMGSENNEVPGDASRSPNCHSDAVHRDSTIDAEIGQPSASSGLQLCEGAVEPVDSEFEELYGPDKEPLIKKFPDGELLSPHGEGKTETQSENNDCHKEEEQVLDKLENGAEFRNGNLAENASVSTITDKSNVSGTGENFQKKEQSNNENQVAKKVEAYIKEHIRPLCKSGVISAEQYRWAVAKTTDKVMKYHCKSKNANFLIKEGEKVKKLAEQYVETAQQNRKS